MIDLERDSNGEVILKPVTGWRILPVAGTLVLAVVLYADSPEGFERGEHKQTQFLLTPPQCLELSQVLTTLAQILLAQSGDPDGAN